MLLNVVVRRGIFFSPPRRREKLLNQFSVRSSSGWRLWVKESFGVPPSPEIDLFESKA
jgi:hypothetical protein